MHAAAGIVTFFIADDYPVFRDGMERDLPESFAECTIEKFDNTNEVLHALNRCKHAVIFLGVNVCHQPAEEVCRQLLKQRPEARVIVMTHIHDTHLAEKIFTAGGVGCLTYRADADEMAFCAKQVLKGKTYLSPDTKEENGRQPQAEGQAYQPTSRQLEVLKLHCKGLINKEIADELGISTNTVNGHVQNLHKNTGTTNRVGLYNYAKARRWV